MVIFAVIVFGLFIAGFLVFVAANAGRGQADIEELLKGERNEPKAPTED